MARIKGAMMTRKRRKKVLKLAKGYYGSKSKHFKMAKQQVMKGGNYAFADIIRYLSYGEGCQWIKKIRETPARVGPK